MRTAVLLRELRRGVRASPASLARRQAGLLRAAVRHAHDRVPLYRRLWAEAGVHPDDVRGPEDLGRVPSLAAEVAREALEGGELVARGVDPARLPAFPTSGSTGRSLWVPRGRIEQRLWTAGALRIWIEHGYRLSHVTAHLDPHAGPPRVLQRLGVSRTAWISPTLDPEHQAHRLRRARPDVVVATPGALRPLARAVAAIGDGDIRPRLVLCHGEVLDTATSQLVERGLGTAPVGLYGLTELGFLAWQCERRDGYHVNVDTCLLEVVHDGRPARPGEVGEVIATDLRGRTSPLIRYETGDLAVLAEGPCACGRPFPLVRSVEGRAADAVRLPGGRLLTTRALVDHMSGVLAPDRYRLGQEGPARFRLHVDRSADGRGPGGPAVVAHLRALLGDVEVHAVDGLPPAAGSSEKSRPLCGGLTRGPPGPLRRCAGRPVR